MRNQVRWNQVKLALTDIADELEGKRVLLRADLDIVCGQVVVHDSQERLQSEFLSSLRFILQCGPRYVIVLGHCGDPGGRPRATLGLQPVFNLMKEVLEKKEALFVHTVYDRTLEILCENPMPGMVFMLENVRFRVEEYQEYLMSQFVSRDDSSQEHCEDDKGGHESDDDDEKMSHAVQLVSRDDSSQEHCEKMSRVDRDGGSRRRQKRDSVSSSAAKIIEKRKAVVDDIRHDLAYRVDIFVQDCFPNLSREDLSMSIPAPTRVLGPRLVQHLSAMERLLFEPKRKLLVIVGGSSLQKKEEAVKALCMLADVILFVGQTGMAMVNAKFGTPVSGVPNSDLKAARRLSESLRASNKEFIVPLDVVCVPKDYKDDIQAFSVDLENEVGRRRGVKKDEVLADVGGKTLKILKKTMSKARHNVLWGPLGLCDGSKLSARSTYLALDYMERARVELKAFSMVIGATLLNLVHRRGIKLDYATSSSPTVAAMLVDAPMPSLSTLTNSGEL